MLITAISDTHGNYKNVSIPECDILLICGDIVPLNIQANIYKSFKWFENKFIKWCQDLPVKQIYLIGGNHDFFLLNREHTIDLYLNDTKIKYLNNSGAEYTDDDGICWTIWGSPLCHIFGNWAFMYSPEYEKEKFSLMPENLDILITHDAPYGRNDVCFESPWNNGEHIGNKELLEEVQLKKPKYHFTGHLHTSDHNLVDYDGTKTACVSLLDESYSLSYKPLTLQLTK